MSVLEDFCLPHIIPDMKGSFLWLLMVLLSAAPALAQEFEWVRGIGSPKYDDVVDLKTDEQGNAYVLYSAWGPITIGSQTLDLGNTPGFALAKHRPNGEVVWTGHFHTTHGWGEDGNRLPGSGSLSTVRLVRDGKGALYLAGSLSGRTEWFGPAGPETNTVMIARGQMTPFSVPSDIFLIKLTSG